MQYSGKMQTTSFRWVLNILLAGIIFANAEAGRLLGIQTFSLHFSAVWPATGFSLAALLLFGYRAWPGVFVGNFLYNCLHLYLEHTGFYGPLTASIVVSLGSLGQALLGTYFMRRFSTTGYFKTINDVIVFLLAGGFLTCMIAATVATLMLFVYEGLPPENMAFAWLTFWSGDCMGVYIFTPLLLIWSVRRLHTRNSCKEAVCMLVTFISISFLFDYVSKYPVGYLFIPFSIWTALRFGFHGATVAVLLISGITITITSLGHGSFIYSYPESPLLVLVMLLETILMTALLMAAARNELTYLRKMD
jgi:two-component system, NtrC family, sensor kinase